MKKRICRICKKPINDKRPTCESCKADKQFQTARENMHAMKKWGLVR